VLLEQASNDRGKASIYHQLGRTKYNQGEHKEAIRFYEKLLEIYQKILPPNHPNLAMSYNNIGAMYHEMSEYSKALSFYERAVENGQRPLPSNHPDLQIYRKSLETIKKEIVKNIYLSKNKIKL